MTGTGSARQVLCPGSRGEHHRIYGQRQLLQSGFDHPRRSGNAELLAVQTVSPDEYREIMSTSWKSSKGRPELPEEIKNLDEPPQERTFIRLLAARYKAGLLHLGLKCSCRDGLGLSPDAWWMMSHMEWKCEVQT